MRLQNILAQAGIASRRKSAEIIQDGRVQVNGVVQITPGTAVDLLTDKVTVDGVLVKAETKRYFIFHKPLNVITTMRDESGRKSVVEFFSSIEERVYPVGRLDRNTTGLLIMTNDGEFANGLTHPRHEIEKHYVAVVDQRLNPSQMKRFEMGIAIDKKKTAPCKVIARGATRIGHSYEIILHEGRNRQIRKMMEWFDCQVKYLHRHQIGPIKLGNLEVGEYRELKPAEVEKLKKLV